MRGLAEPLGVGWARGATTGRCTDAGGKASTRPSLAFEQVAGVGETEVLTAVVGEGVGLASWLAGPPVQADVAIAASSAARAVLIPMRRIMRAIGSAANDCRIRACSAR